MADSTCTEAQFLHDMQHHTMEVLHDDGVYRHIEVSEPGTLNHRYEVVTWPDYLCICGDMGEYVFQRTNDMFNFFRMRDYDICKKPENRLSINPYYWEEKLQSTDTRTGHRMFDESAFRDRVEQMFSEYWDDYEYNEDIDETDRRADCRDEIEQSVLRWADDGEHEAYRAVTDFSYDDFIFQDFFDGGGTEKFTYHFIWCLYAIVYAIEQYDQAQLAKTA